MSDEQNAIPVSDPGVPAKKPGMLSTAGGRILAIVLGVTVVAIILGVAAAIVLNVFAGSDDGLDDQLAQPAGAPNPPGTSAAATSTPVAAAPAVAVSNSEVFTFRDIFVPLLNPIEEVAASPATPGTGGTTDTVTPTTEGVLYLTNIISESGVAKAVLSYNGVTYTLGPGEPVPGTPWQVLRVSTTSVTMLYGDIQVSLSIGQGRAK